MQLQNNSNVEQLKGQLEVLTCSNEELTDKVKQLEKDNQKIKRENKDLFVYQESIQSELQHNKHLIKDKETELKEVKTDCAAALLGKEKTLHLKLNDLANEVSDLKFSN